MRFWLSFVVLLFTLIPITESFAEELDLEYGEYYSPGNTWIELTHSAINPPPWRVDWSMEHPGEYYPKEWQEISGEIHLIKQFYEKHNDILILDAIHSGKNAQLCEALGCIWGTYHLLLSEYDYLKLQQMNFEHAVLADFNNTFDKPILLYSPYWNPALPEDYHITQTFADKNNELWIFINKENLDVSNNYTKHDTIENNGIVINVEPNPIPSYLQPVMINEKSKDTKFSISMNYQNFRVSLSSSNFDESQLKVLGRSTLGWQFWMQDYNDNLTNQPQIESYMNKGGSTTILPKYSINLSSLDKALEQAQQNTMKGGKPDVLLFPKFVPNDLELKIVEKNNSYHKPHVTLWYFPSKVNPNDIHFVGDFYETGGKRIFIYQNPFELGEHYRPIDGFIVKEQYGVGLKVYDSDYEINLRPNDSSLENMKMLASIISEEDVYSQFDNLIVYEKRQDGTLIFKNNSDSESKTFTNLGNKKYLFEEQTYFFSPKQQINNGTAPIDVICQEGLKLIFKSKDNSPVCVTPLTAEKLSERGWTNS